MAESTTNDAGSGDTTGQQPPSTPIVIQQPTSDGPAFVVGPWPERTRVTAHFDGKIAERDGDLIRFNVQNGIAEYRILDDGATPSADNPLGQMLVELLPGSAYEPAPDGITGAGSAGGPGVTTPGADRVIIEANTETGAVTKVDTAPHAPSSQGDTGSPNAQGTEQLDPASPAGAAAQHDAAAGASSDPAVKEVEAIPVDDVLLNMPESQAVVLYREHGLSGAQSHDDVIAMLQAKRDEGVIPDDDALRALEDSGLKGLLAYHDAPRDGTIQNKADAVAWLATKRDAAQAPPPSTDPVPATPPAPAAVDDRHTMSRGPQ